VALGLIVLEAQVLNTSSPLFSQFLLGIKFEILTLPISFTMATMSVVDDALTSGGQNAFIDPARKGSVIRTSAELDLTEQELSGTPGYYPNGHQIPTEDELQSLRRVAGKMPMTTYLLCAVEFAERASYYGCNVSILP
jgi:hypothetical protein